MNEIILVHHQQRINDFSEICSSLYSFPLLSTSAIIIYVTILKSIVDPVQSCLMPVVISIFVLMSPRCISV